MIVNMVRTDNCKETFDNIVKISENNGYIDFTEEDGWNTSHLAEEITRISIKMDKKQDK